MKFMELSDQFQSDNDVVTSSLEGKSYFLICYWKRHPSFFNFRCFFVLLAFSCKNHLKLFPGTAPTINWAHASLFFFQEIWKFCAPLSLSLSSSTFDERAKYFIRTSRKKRQIKEEKNDAEDERKKMKKMPLAILAWISTLIRLCWQFWFRGKGVRLSGWVLNRKFSC